MYKIYSQIDPKKLLHIVVRSEDFAEGRTDISDVNEWLQISTLNMKKGTTFKPHMHIFKDVPKQAIAQESWICIKGEVKCMYYDTDGTFLEEVTIFPGDASITYYGGHNYLGVGDFMVYEVKTGPYQGIEYDKVQIKIQKK